MNPTTESVFQFLQAQSSLLSELRRAHASSQDLKWLLDFPSKGNVRLPNGEVWAFSKHGAGIRFVRAGHEPQVVIDVHRNLDKPLMVDKWRLTQFLESIGESTGGGKEVDSLLAKMCTEGQLTTQGDGTYEKRK